RYRARWLDGNGCVPIHWLMEDAATAEIARAQLWQWLHAADGGCCPLHLDDGTVIDEALFDRVLLCLPSRLAGQPVIGAARVPEAIAMLEALTHRATLEDLLTLPAYERICPAALPPRVPRLPPAAAPPLESTSSASTASRAPARPTRCGGH